MTVTLRPATAGDAATVTEIHTLSRESYYGAALDPSDAARSRFPMWRRLLTAPSVTVMLAELAEEPLGFIAAREDTAPSVPVELVGLYVHPDRFGQGIGNQLHHWFTDEFASLPAHLEVWGGNDRAQAFYRQRQWHPTSQSRPGPAGHAFVTWHRYPARLPEDQRHLHTDTVRDNAR